MLAELLNTTNAYLMGRITLHQLEEWLLTNLQSILDCGDDRAIKIANELDADLVEFGENLIDKSTIREHLQRYCVFAMPIIYSDSPASASTDVSILADAVPVNEYAFSLP